MQLVYSGATPGQTVTVKVTGAASQPFLDIQPGEDSSQAIADFIQALDADKADWLEIRSGSVEVHAKVEGPWLDRQGLWRRRPALHP